MAPQPPCALRVAPRLRSAVSRKDGANQPARGPLGSGGTGPSAALELLAVAYGYAVGVPPCTWPRGARNAARPTCAEAPWGTTQTQIRSRMNSGVNRVRYPLRALKVPVTRKNPSITKRTPEII